MFEEDLFPVTNYLQDMSPGRSEIDNKFGASLHPEIEVTLSSSDKMLHEDEEVEDLQNQDDLYLRYHVKACFIVIWEVI